MRLSAGNILFVKEHRMDGKDNGWYVGMKSRCVSDGREYKDASCLPRTVKKFCEMHTRREWEKLKWQYRGEEVCETITYIYE